MEPAILVGTAKGLSSLDVDGVSHREALAGHDVTALIQDAGRLWAIVDGKTLWTAQGDGEWERVAEVEGPPATCLAGTATGVLVGTEQAHLFRLADGRLTPVASFETVEGRDTWYTPWGDPADVRSITAGPDGVVYVNVHVGGVVRSTDGGRSWTPTLDIEEDVHQVLAHPMTRGLVFVAAAEGFGVSRDGGASWEFANAGLHAHYLRAVVVADDMVLVSASTSYRGKRSAVYRKRLDASAFERGQAGLPKWFDDHIDTACLAAAGRVVAFGTDDGRVYRSKDAGEPWELIAKGLPSVRCVIIA